MANFRITLMALTFPLTCIAQDQPFFVGVGYGHTDYQAPGITAPGILPGQDFTEDTKLEKLYLGYWFKEWFSLDIGYANFGSVSERYQRDLDVMTFLAVNNEETVDFDAITLSATFEYPLADKLRLSGALSYSQLDFDQYVFGGIFPRSSSMTDSGFSYGVGIRYRASARFSVRVLLEAIEVGDRDLDNVGVFFEAGI